MKSYLASVLVGVSLLAASFAPAFAGKGQPAPAAPAACCTVDTCSKCCSKDCTGEKCAACCASKAACCGAAMACCDMGK